MSKKLDLSPSDLQNLDAVGRVFLLSYWAEKIGLILDGRTFSFKDHEYLVDIYMDTHPYKVFKKGAQLGFSTFEILSAIHGCENLYPTGVLHLLPTKDDVQDFSKSKYGRLIDDNPDTLGTLIKNTDQSTIKQIGYSFLYLRGSRSRTQLKSISVDKIILDEYDEMRPGTGVTSADRSARFDPEALADERMSHSEYKHKDVLSTPTLPDYGIEAKFALSDQKHWYIQCSKCSKFTCLELTFPDCLVPQKDGRVIRACHHCGAELDPSNGRWDAHSKGNTEMSGYYISQLCSKVIDPKIIYDQYMSLDTLTPTKRTEFWNSKLGIGYVEIQDRLTKQQVYELCEATPMVSAHKGDDEGTCIMGVDQGDKLHVVIGKKTGQNTKRIIHLGHYSEWEELDNLMTSFNVWRCVVDAQPEMRNARAFANRWPGRVFLNFYNYRMKGTTRWNYKDLMVEENRTESLDASHNDILYGYLALPRRSVEIEEMARHCVSIAKRLEEDLDTGSKEYVYVKLSAADHYRHALNYFCIAALEAPLSTRRTNSSMLEEFRRGQNGLNMEPEGEICDTYH